MVRKSIIEEFSAEAFVFGLKMSAMGRVNAESSGSVNDFMEAGLVSASAFSGRIAAYCSDCTAANICVIEEQTKLVVPLNVERKRSAVLAYSPSPVKVQKGIFEICGR